MSELPGVEALAVAFVATRELVAIVAAGVVLSSLDDLAIDLAHIARSVWKRLTGRGGGVTAAELGSADPGWMAIFVPAWDESTVVAAMLRDLTARLDYPRYIVFVGTYGNDPATRAAAETVVDPRIIGITVPRPGPTTKADCLNSLWRAALAYESVVGMRFKAVVLHDAEDVVHRHELKIYDRFIPDAAMVQLPVVPLPDPTSPLIAGHYMDEFAEAHGKDILIREALGAAVPSAGVACAIDRGMLVRVAETNGGMPFDPDCLVEDYELGLRIKTLGGRTAFVRIRGGNGERGPAATREHFPANFRAAVRQKSRWLQGIALHGWDRLGWPGGWANRLMLLRDRKSIATATLTFLAYLSLLLIVIQTAIRELYPPAAAFPPLIPTGGALEKLLEINFAILVWRLAMRAWFTGQTYGWREALRSVPRVFVGNIINIFAAMRAVRRYIATLLGQRLRWDKTDHQFPATVDA